MSGREFDKQAAPLARRLTNMIARGVLLIANSAKKMQTLQLGLLAGETADGIEHFEPYGFTSNPLAGAEHVTVFVDGDRAHGITLVVADRRYRLQGLVAGEMAIHDDQGQKVHLMRGGIVIDGAGLPISVIGNVTITGTLAVTQAVSMQASLAVIGGITEDGVNIGNNHTHSGVQAGSGNTGPPN